MGIVQSATGLFTANFTATLPGASSASNGVVLIIAGDTTITTPTNWNLRTSQINLMGHYWFDRLNVSLTSIAVTLGGTGSGSWYIAEIQGAAYDTATSVNAATAATTYSTPAIAPTAGTREVYASIASVASGGGNFARTVSGWTNSFIEIADLCATVAPAPMQGVATLDDLAADGVATQTTTATYSLSSEGRSALTASYATSTGGAVAVARNRRVGKRQW